jgi:hypothetical protein
MAKTKRTKVQPSGYSCDKSSMGKGSDCDYNKQEEGVHFKLAYDHKHDKKCQIMYLEQL